MVSRDDAKAVYICANALVAIGAVAAAFGDPDSGAVAAGVAVVLAGLLGSMIAFTTLARAGALDPAPDSDARATRRTVGLALGVAAFVPTVLGVALPAAAAVQAAALGVKLVAPVVRALI